MVEGWSQNEGMPRSWWGIGLWKDSRNWVCWREWHFEYGDDYVNVLLFIVGKERIMF